MWLAYNVFVTGMQTTPLSQATVGVVFPIVIYLNYSALSDAGRHSYSQGTRPAFGDLYAEFVCISRAHTRRFAEQASPTKRGGPRAKEAGWAVGDEKAPTLPARAAAV